MHGTKKEGASATSFTASVNLKCAWDDRFTLADDLVTNERSWPYFAPAKARQVSITPVYAKYTTSAQTCEYEEAILSVNYSTDADRDLITESIEPTAGIDASAHDPFQTIVCTLPTWCLR